jgi:predicted N-acetyltransferase YhbS
MGTFVSPESEPALTSALLTRYAEQLATIFPAWGRTQADALVKQWHQGWLTVLVWQSGDAERRGLAFTNQSSRGLQVHGLILEPDNSATLLGFLSDLEEDGPGPLHALTDMLPGIEPGAQPGLLRRRGFWHRAKVLMRRPVSGPSSIAALTREGHLRSPVSSDLEAIVHLYARAFTDRPGEFWVWSSPDPEADAREYLAQYIGPDGSWSLDFVPGASAIWESEGAVVGAVLVESTVGRLPTVANLMVDPDHQRRGIGRRLMQHALQTLDVTNPGPVELVAIRGGAPFQLYQELGFGEVPPPDGRREGHWVRGEAPSAAIEQG